ncbi:hypothetical protein ACHWQZ_G000193 [Mnemiopsis leidyi]
MGKLTPEEQTRFSEQKTCYLCNNWGKSVLNRDLDHCHYKYTGSVPKGYTHKECYPSKSHIEVPPSYILLERL